MHLERVGHGHHQGIGLLRVQALHQHDLVLLERGDAPVMFLCDLVRRQYQQSAAIFYDGAGALSGRLSADLWCVVHPCISL